jgi:hypothetical protein
MRRWVLVISLVRFKNTGKDVIGLTIAKSAIKVVTSLLNFMPSV